ncbi:hypothetical protein F5B22DRAFT_630511 [Xylaria bambusicola]|uniref:uncharacterized protein n=1 Tax=Xylaria bambusicola TaxID=326684 RepID=UPI0020076AE0|nr:uncharacterized protein F5B22DRAFT_630511 [Xylaria bambusicola]KAI0503122.1 hypothetical protein F5B22DRAFT_630511 [Xylaria bambusicola]
MSNDKGSNVPHWEGNNDETPTHHPPWPFVDPFLQGRFEKRFIAEGETLNFDNLPKLQFWSSWAGIDDRISTPYILSRLQTHAIAIQRPLTGIEANAVAEHSIHGLRYLSWIQPVASAIALGISVSKRRTFSFPFYRPKMQKFDPYSFPTKKFQILKGQHAARVWHVVRFIAYYPFAFVPSILFFNSMCENSQVAHTKRDPRLQSMVQEIRQNAPRLLHMRARNQPIDMPGDAGYTGNSPHQDNENTGYSSRPTPESLGSLPRVSNSARSPPPGRGDTDDLFDDDDASPVALSARRQETRQGQISSPGSSWDRIRQQAKSGSPDWERGDSSGQERGWGRLRQDKSQDTRDSDPRTDSYSYSPEDEEREKRNYEKEQAQKEFDAVLEAERRGEGDSKISRGWRR